MTAGSGGTGPEVAAGPEGATSTGNSGAAATAGESREMTNAGVVRRFDRVADLLEEAEANPFRVRSYRRAAEEIRALDRPVGELYEEGGRDRLRAVPGVGERLSGAIVELLETGRLGLLDQLETERAPEAAFRRLPGIGPELARRIHEELGLRTLEGLEHAAHTSRLSSVEGIGEKRVRGIRDALAGLLGRSARRRARERVQGEGSAAEPPVGLLLAVDAEYREKAEEDELRRIAPRRFNPSGDAWLPVMDVERDGWEVHALFSNTRQAHELGRTRDWVVLYYDRDGEHGQATAVTARSGPLEGRRVIRGREAECRRHYARRDGG